MSNLGASKRSLTKVAWVAAVLLPVVAIVLAFVWLGKPSQAAPPVPMSEDISRLESFQNGFTAVANAIKPSVVFIEVEEKVPSQNLPGASDDSGGNDPWQQFFGPDAPQMPFVLPQRPQPQRPTVGQGSGVIVDPSGYILTNNHVVRDASKVTVHLEDGEAYPARVMGTDPMTDLAIIKIEPKRALPAAHLGNADKAKVGQWAIAVGYPFGGRSNGASSVGGVFDEQLHFEASITVGVVSALNRQTDSDRQGYPFRDLIQTDAPINPGNSGGPLVNIRGEVVGINQQIFTSSPMGGNIGVGFAIPINPHTRAIIDTLKSGHKVVRGRLGMSVAPLTDTLQKVWGAKSGVFVEDVMKGSPAERAGIKPDDIVLAYQGKPVSTQDDFVDMVQNTKPGTRAQLELLRNGKRLTLTATVEAINTPTPQKRAEATEPAKMGLTVEDLPQDMAAKAGLPGGVLVRSVEPMSDAALADIHPNDIITEVNRDPVTDTESYRKAVAGLKPGDPVAIRIWRGGQSETVEIESLSK